MKLSDSQHTKIRRALDQHEKFKSAYFWRPPQTAGGRRNMEKRESFEVSFRNAGTVYRYASEVRCSCRNVYYTGTFEVDGQTKTVRVFKNLIR